MWIGLGVLLLVVWAVAYLVFQVASAALHLLIVAALIAGAVHLLQRYRERHGAPAA